MKSYQVYVFDLDDTLLDTFRTVSGHHYPLLAERLGLRYRGEASARRSWGRDLAECLGEVFEGSQPAERLLAELAGIHREHPVRPVDGALEILRALRKHDKFVAVVSAGLPAIVESNVQRSLPGLVDHVCSTVAQGTPKPSPAILDGIAAAYRQARGTAPEREEIVYVGDSLADLLTARAHGVDFAAVTTGVHDRADFLAAGLPAEWIFPSLAQAVVPPDSHGVVALIQNQAGEYLLVQEARPDNPFFGAWSGPHGRCLPADILEEETVVRETLEECGLEVRPVRKVYERAADTRIDTVAFWESLPVGDLDGVRIAHAKEVAAVRWASLAEILSGGLDLYAGTYDYFFHHAGRASAAATRGAHGPDR